MCRPAEIAPTMTVAGLFAGIGGVERGFELAGFKTALLCELDESAQRVLESHFPAVPIFGDVKELRSIGQVDVLCAGFPCQDLSQAGQTAGINGRQSGLVSEVFRLLDAKVVPQWIVFENVPFMLHLDKGNAMRVLTKELEKRQFRWAYRIVNAQAFGLPQRRRRVVIIASREHDPRPCILNQEANQSPSKGTGHSFGFYWTEGNTGLGWAVDSIPTLKGGSSIGIPSPPGIWIPGSGLFTPEIRDAERLQGFPADWTSMASARQKQGARWKLVGNAVPVPMAKWVAERLSSKEVFDSETSLALDENAAWPKAGWGCCGRRFSSPASEWPVNLPVTPLSAYLQYPMKLLSFAATAGFYKRIQASNLRLVEAFVEAVGDHLEAVRPLQTRTDPAGREFEATVV